MFDLPIYKIHRLFPHYFLYRVEEDEKKEHGDAHTHTYTHWDVYIEALQFKNKQKKEQKRTERRKGKTGIFPGTK